MSNDSTAPKDTPTETPKEVVEGTVAGQAPVIIPDEHLDYLTADSELTEDLPEDTDSIELIQLKIRSLEDLNLLRFKKLTSLCLRQNLIQSMSEVEVLPVETMTNLDLYDNRIKHISSNVNKLMNLTNLDYSHRWHFLLVRS